MIEETAAAKNDDYFPGFKLPKISVVITCYNYSKFVLDAAHSIQQQSYSNFECLMIDDCSTDDSFGKMEAFIRETGDDRFRCLRLGRNLGQMGATKVGVENTSGPFITLVDADDILTKDFLKTHLEVHLNDSHSAALTASDTFQIDQNGCALEATYHSLNKQRTNSGKLAPVKDIAADAIGNIIDDQLSYKGHPSTVRYVESTVEGWNVVAMSSLMFRRDVLELIVPDKVDELRICADFYLVSFAHRIGGTLTIGKSLSAFRMHRKNNFSFNPILGGRHSPGYFTEARLTLVHREMARHAQSRLDRLSRIIGEKLCREIIERYGKPDAASAASIKISTESKYHSAVAPEHDGETHAAAPPSRRRLFSKILSKSRK